MSEDAVDPSLGRPEPGMEASEAPEGAGAAPGEVRKADATEVGDHQWSSRAVAEEDERRRQAQVRRQRLEDGGPKAPDQPKHKLAVKEGGGAARWVASLTVAALVVSAFTVGLILRVGVGVGDPPPAAAPAVAAGFTGATGAPASATGPAAPAPPSPPAAPNPALATICRLPEERVNATGELYHGTDPDRNLLPYSPFRIINFPCTNFDPDVRVTLLYRDAIVLLEGGLLLRAIPFDAGEEVTFPEIVEAINDADWMAEVAEGVYEVDTAFIQLGNTQVSIRGPETIELRLTDRPHVFLGGRGAQVTFEDTTVTSWNDERGGPDLAPEDGRAFILYERGSRLDILRSRFLYLGSDRSGAYGVSWRTGGTTGSAIESEFAHSWFGVYTFEARDIVFRGNTFRDNTYYGLDPHDRSTGLIVEDNVAYGNGSHALIFSRGVADSVLRNNHVYDNGGNGIVLDAFSDRNVIENNLVERNKGDGIVLIGSGHSLIVNNTVRSNRTGIRLHRIGSSDIEIRGNVLDGNRAGIHAYGGAHNIVIEGNVISNSSRPGITVQAGATRIVDTIIHSAPVGIEIGTAVDIEGVEISEVDRGIVVRSDSILEIRSSAIEAVDAAIRLHPQALASIGDQVGLNAPDPVHVPVPTLYWRRWLPLVGLAAIVIAVVLEIFRIARTREEAFGLAPPGVTNIR